MSMPGKINVQTSTLQKILVSQRTAGAFAPHPCLFAKRQPNLKRRDNFLRDTILEVENIIDTAIVAIGPQVAAVQAVNQLRRQPDSIADLADAPLQHITSTQNPSNFAYVPCLPFEYEARIAGYDQELLDLRQGGQNVFGDAIGKILLLGVAAHVLKRQHGDRRLVRNRARLKWSKKGRLWGR